MKPKQHQAIVLIRGGVNAVCGKLVVLALKCVVTKKQDGHGGPKMTTAKTPTERKMDKSLAAINKSLGNMKELVQECHDILTTLPSGASE